MKNIDYHFFNDFEYIKDYNLEENGLTIKHKIEKPNYLYKFYSLSKLNVDALLNAYFYAAHPFEVNDALDSTPFLYYTNRQLEFKLYENLLKGMMKSEDIKKFYIDDVKNQCKRYISLLYELSTNLFGLISMTEKDNNPLMWPHYTGEEGFQIKINTEKLENSIKKKLAVEDEYIGLFPINYSKKLHPIDISQFQTFIIPLLYITNIKLKQWKYENEWRFIVGKPQMGVPYSKVGLSSSNDYNVEIKNRYIYYDKELIDEICFGFNFFNGKRFEIVWKSDRVFEVKLKNTSNEIEFRILQYISEHLNDKLFYSGIKYEQNEKKQLYLIRTKERLDIKKDSDNTYTFSRTNNVIKLI